MGNQVVVDRAQTAGPGTLNIPTETIYELGNYQSVATIRDTADLTFSMESLDVSAEIEAMLTGQDFTALPDGAEINLANLLPIDVASQFKKGRTATNPFDVRASVAIPYLTPESIAYRFGIRDNASQTISLRGDSVYFTGGASAYIEEAVGTATANQTVVLAHAVVPYSGDTISGTRYALGVSLVSGKRLSYGADYTETVAGAGVTKGVSVVVLAPVPVDDAIRVIYQSDVAAVYPQITHAAASATRPAAVKGRDIEVRVGGVTISDRWSSVQAVTFEQRLTLEKDEEFGNPNAVANDYDVPAVTGTIDLKPRDVDELMLRVRQIAGVSNTLEVVGPYQTALLPLEILIHSPDTGDVLKTLYSPDARFTLPSFSGRVQQKIGVTFSWMSDGGSSFVYKGAKP